LRPVGLAKWRVWCWRFHNRSQLRLEANGAGICSEDGMQIREAS
jgi:hypothetical protein